LSPGSGTPGPEADVRRPARATPSPTRITSGNQRLFVQAASFVTRDQAERARRAVAEYGQTRIYTAYVDDQLRYRVRIGPMATPERSERVRAALIRRGYGDAIIVRD
jgi:cell division protein FtsN